MDELGYVIYAPTLSVAGLRNPNPNPNPNPGPNPKPSPKPSPNPNPNQVAGLRNLCSADNLRGMP